jgi:hypothetical protein
MEHKKPSFTAGCNDRQVGSWRRALAPDYAAVWILARRLSVQMFQARVAQMQAQGGEAGKQKHIHILLIFQQSNAADK